MEATEIPGLVLLPLLDSQEQKELLDWIDLRPWEDVAFHARKVQQYGWRYSYSPPGIGEFLGELPQPLLYWARTLTRLHLAQWENKIPEQVIVNRYFRGQGIGAHADHRQSFGPTVATISLGASASMILSNSRQKLTCSVNLEPGDLLVLSGKSRYDWMHELPLNWAESRTESGPPIRRVSVTFRTVKSK